MTPGQTRVLRVLADGGAMSTWRVGDVTGRGYGSVYGVLRGLEHRGLVRRTYAAHAVPTGPVFNWQVTDDGRKALDGQA